jgi:antiviral helicase SKI2
MLVGDWAKPCGAGHKKASRAKAARSSERDNSFGAKGRRGGKSAQDKGIYVALTHMLQEKKLQPCVVFTFSKKRCETNADSIMSVDMLEAEQKGLVHKFIDQSVARLKGSDRKLPQIARMRDMLKRGIGVRRFPLFMFAAVR